METATTILASKYEMPRTGEEPQRRTERRPPLRYPAQYSYDNIYELTQAVVNGSAPEGYTYDAVGNRLTSAGPTTYNYNSSNELTSTSTATYTYDNNGNTTSKTDSNGTTSYTWDFENRLTQVTLPGQGGTVSFKYDPFGRIRGAGRIRGSGTLFSARGVPGGVFQSALCHRSRHLGDRKGT